jgi:deoxyribodipyrimidine photo-lyase
VIFFSVKNDMKKYQHALVWMRRDLRLHDHPALAYALTYAERVTCLFIFDETILKPLRRQEGDARVTFLIRTLKDLKGRFQKETPAVSDFLILHGNPEELVPRLAKEVAADLVVTHRDFEPKARRRDENVQKNLRHEGQDFILLKDHSLMFPEEIQTKEKTAYKVFTPYKRAWLAHMNENPALVFGNFKTNAPARKLSALQGPSWVQDLCFQKEATEEAWHEALDFSIEREISSLWPIEQKSVQQRLNDFIEEKVAMYGTSRDIPSLIGTSRLSPYLRFGLVSAREVVRALSRDGLFHFHGGAETYLSELIWRDFYFMILSEFPHVATKAFRPEYDRIPWTSGREGDELFERWKTGTTGVPIVDAGMRELNTTGWMHNRVRMITANYLCKIMLLDWRRGEAYFAEKLMDFDLSANNGGWQWSSSSGCDAQPYFRIFNPTAQAEKFDPEGAYIKKFSSESKHHPIVDYKIQRERCLALYAQYVKKGEVR